MTRRKDELSNAAIDGEFPFQIALPADQVAGKNHELAKAAVKLTPREKKKLGDQARPLSGI